MRRAKRETGKGLRCGGMMRDLVAMECIRISNLSWSRSAKWVAGGACQRSVARCRVARGLPFDATSRRETVLYQLPFAYLNPASFAANRSGRARSMRLALVSIHRARTRARNAEAIAAEPRPKGPPRRAEPKLGGCTRCCSQRLRRVRAWRQPHRPLGGGGGAAHVCPQFPSLLIPRPRAQRPEACTCHSAQRAAAPAVYTR